jgi:hypothetical protein
MDQKEYGISERNLIFGTAPLFALTNWEKPRNTAVKIVGIQAEIRTRDFPK